jgi:hypothetical protein
MLDKDGHNSLHAKGWVGGKARLVTVDTGASVTIIRPDIAVRLLKKDLPTKCALQMASWEALPILKEALVTVTLGQNPLSSWVFAFNVTDEFIQGLDIHAHGASVDLRHHVL